MRCGDRSIPGGTPARLKLELQDYGLRLSWIERIRSEKTMAKTICRILGAVFLIMGIIGFAVPDLMGAHLSAAHNIIHLVSGAAALYFGMRGTYPAAQRFCLVFGAVYGFLGIAGLFMGHGVATVPPAEHSSHMMKLIPGQLELGGVDHAIHIVLAGLFLIGGLSKPRRIGDRVSSVVDKAKVKL